MSRQGDQVLPFVFIITLYDNGRNAVVKEFPVRYVIVIRIRLNKLDMTRFNLHGFNDRKIYPPLPDAAVSSISSHLTQPMRFLSTVYICAAIFVFSKWSTSGMRNYDFFKKEKLLWTLLDLFPVFLG